MQHTLEFRAVALWVVLAASSMACVGPTGGAALAAQEQTAQDDEPICRRETVVGSHLRERRCYTRAQREEMRRQAGEFLEEEGRPLVFPGAE